ncbi:MAG: tRNA pseudouridine(38-40) synthase TruA, partial [Antricoccus sp.]
MSPSNDFTTEPVTSVGGDGLFVRIRLDIAYDGTGFVGWAVQPGRRTVAGVLTEALRTILRTDVRLTVAGRTDAGVHATGQVAHFDLSEQRWQSHASRLSRSLAGLLPRDVRVHGVQRVPPEFNARYSGLFRRYRYRISDAAWGVSPLQRNDVAHWPRRLDLARVRLASVPLVGLHDFAAFCRRRDGASTIRNLQRLDWSGAGGILEATVQADAFCHSMVRSVVGALL